MIESKVTIIVPVYNSELYLQDTFNSINSQDYENIEVIMVDDGSTDNSFDLMKNLTLRDNRLKIYKQQNSGPSAARNKAIIESSGYFILPVDSDDLLSPNYVRLCVEEFINNTDIKLVYGGAEYFGQKTGKWDLPVYSFDNLLTDNMIHCSAMFKKEDALKVGLYNEDLKHGFEDWDFWLRFLSKDDRVVYLKDAVLYYRTRSNSRNNKIIANKSQVDETLNLIIIKNLSKYNYNNIMDMYLHLKNQQKYAEKINDSLRSLHNHLSYFELFKLVVKKLIRYNK